VQETLLAAWKGIDALEDRSSLRSWLYRIATNRSLNALRSRSRRPHALEPFPDEDIPDATPGPEARYEQREATELAFVAALQRLPPRQSAALVLRDVLGFSAEEVAGILETGETSVKGLLQRARAQLPAERPARPSSAHERRLVTRFADAVQTGDIDAVVALLTDDGRLTMPPLALEFTGRAPIAAFLRERAEERGAPLQVVETRANAQPALACYLGDRPYGMIVLTLAEQAVSEITWFADPAVLGYFDVPRTLRPRPD